MVTELMASADHLPQDVRMALGGEPRHEKGCREVMQLQEIEDAWHANVRAIGRL
jgi:hypothetical protein